MSNGCVSNLNDKVQLSVHTTGQKVQTTSMSKTTFEEMVMNWICLGFWETRSQTALGTMELALKF